MITRDNYKEFFLLYIDNELPVQDRRVVEEWVAANPDLQEEWESLLQCRLLPEEDIVFRDKENLLRKTGEIQENNYTDYFLSYIDDELSPGDRLMVESFIRLDPSKLSDLEQLRHTVSIPDTLIVFPDKNSLYKYEKHRRVVVFYRLLAGAAAILLAAVALLFLQRHPSHEPALVNNTQDIPARTNKKSPSPVTPAATAALYPTEGSETVKQGAAGKVIKKTPGPLPAHQKEKNSPATGNHNSGDQAIQLRATDVAIVVPEHDDAIEVTTEGSPIKTGSLPVTAKQVTIPRELSSFATQALLQENNEKVIATAFEPPPPGKNKFRGLIRKVTRTFGKTADRDGEGKREVLINAFQVAVD